jgi:hypothetical protein
LSNSPRRRRPEKTFDCLAFKDRAQARLIEETRGMTAEQETAYLTRKAEEGPLGEWWKKVKAATASRKAPAGK